MIRLSRRSALLGTLAAGLAAPALVRAYTPLLRVGAILPLGGSGLPEAGVNQAVPAMSARMGLSHALDELMRAAPVDQPPVRLFMANAPEAGSARRAAERMVQKDGATVLIGGFMSADARAIADVAGKAGALFINIAAPAAALRRDLCGDAILHVEAAASTYLDALAGVHLAEGRERWHLVHQDDAEHAALLALAEDRLGARITGTTRIGSDPSGFGPALRALGGGQADVVLLLTDWLTQLNLLSRAEPLGGAVPVTGFPWAATQTRAFYNRCRQIAPTVGAAARVALWEAGADTPEAQALNADFLARWRQPMDASAWAASAALRLAVRGADGCGSSDGRAIGAWLARQRGLDASKDQALVVDRADAQLRQPLFAVRPDPAASIETTPDAMLEWAQYLGRIDDPGRASGAAGCPIDGRAAALR